MRTLALLAVAALAACADDSARALLEVRRIYVDKLTGGEPAAQIRDMIISSLQATRLFVITENPDRADTFLRGAAEDLVYTDTFQSSDSIDARAGVATSADRGSPSRRGRSASVSLGQSESSRIAERKHEAVAAVRLVNKDGDVIWSTTQESTGAKFRGSSADVADKIARQLAADVAKARKEAAAK